MTHSELSDGDWQTNPVFGEGFAQQVAAQLAFDSPMLTERGGVPLEVATRCAVLVQCQISRRNPGIAKSGGQ